MDHSPRFGALPMIRHTSVAWSVAAQQQGFEAFQFGGSSDRRHLSNCELAGATLWNLATVRGTTVRSSPSHTARSIPIIAAQMSGSSSISQFGRSCELSAGDIAFMDSAKPFATDYSDDARILYLELRDGIYQHLIFQNAVATSGSLENPMNRMLYDYMVSMWQYAPRMKPFQRASALSAAIGLSRLTSAFAVAEDKSNIPIRVVWAKEFIEEHISDPELTPQVVANTQNVSRRYLDDLFVCTGYTLERWIWERRLQRAREEISEAALLSRDTAKSMLEISLDLGFKNPSHFSRLFASRFKITPRAYKKNAFTPQLAA